jgi:hypothetical protein
MSSLPARPQRKPSKTPSTSANEKPESNGGLIFITGGTPAELRSKANMTTVRKKAMDAFLKGDRKTSNKSKSSTGGRSRFSSVDSDSRGSELSFESHDVAADVSTIPTTISQSAGSAGRTSTSSVARFSIAPSRYEHEHDAESAVAKLQEPHDFVLPPSPLFMFCRKGAPMPYDTYTPPPFVSIGKSIDPFRTMFQASHPGVSVEELKFYCSRYFGTKALGKYWIPTALSYSHTFLGTLCLATAYHDVINELPLESVQTIALRQEVIHLVGRNMLDPETRVSDHNLMAIIQLIISEVIGREESGLSWHEDGIENMIKQRGGLNELDVNTRLASAISWVSMATSILREESPRTMYAEYCAANSTKQYRPTAALPESPIFCPRSTWKTIPRSSKCTPKAQELLDDIRTMIDHFLLDSDFQNSQILMSLYEKIISPRQYPPISEIRMSRLLTQHDHKYEAIRIASIIQAVAIIKRLPLSDALSLATVEIQSQSTIVNNSAAAYSSDALVSPLDTHHETPVTENHIRSYSSIHPTSSTVPQPFVSPLDSRASFSSTTSAPRPSISSTHSTSSEYTYFPPPPARNPSDTTSLLINLRTTIERSNISACWSDMAGVLLWIGLVVGAASKKSKSKIHKKYFSAMTMRAGVMLCFEHPEAINSTMVRMVEVVEALGGEKKGEQADDGGKGKRRRV